MHVKITTSGSRRYVQLVESYRDDAGKVKKRTVATLGRLDQVDSQLNAVIQGLMKVSGQVAFGFSQSGQSPDLVNSAPEGEGWFFRLTLSDKSELDGLMDAAAYQSFVDGL